MSGIGQIAGTLIVGLVVFGAPLFIGIGLLVRKNKTAFGWYAALLTLKPLVATPVWYVILANSLESGGLGILLMLPGAVLTILLVAACRDAFSHYTTAESARRLLVLDCARWITSGLWALVGVGFGGGYNNSWLSVCVCGSALVALVLPTIFAFVALAAVRGEIVPVASTNVEKQ
jgi:hypothetical protein